MKNNDEGKCRICRTNIKYNNISESSEYAKFFIHVTSSKESNEELWLCVWCKASMKNAVKLFKLASKHGQFNNMVSSNKFNITSIYELNVIHNIHIDIPPRQYEEKNIIIHPENTDTVKDTEELNTNKITNLTELNYDPNIIITEEIKSLDNSILSDNTLIEPQIKKRSIKAMNIKNYDFTVEYLELQKQLEEIDIKKEKVKHFKYQCRECGVGFQNDDVFENHKLRHTEISGPYICKVCNLRFKSQDVCSQHMLGHSRRFRCQLCDATFKRWAHCVTHRYRCGGIIQLTACNECSKLFNNENDLKIHMKVHKKEYKYICNQCDRQFCSKQRLTIHIRSHMGIKPFSCPQCGRGFTTNSNLRAHASIHSDVTAHYCVECNTYYKTAKSLKRHFQQSVRHASSSYSHKCNDCTKQFASEKLLQYHFKSTHGREFKCQQCEKIFSNNSNLNKHIKCVHAIKE